MPSDQQEIEKKFLLRSYPNLPTARRRRIEQGYLVTEDAELRIRRQSRTCTMTVKSLGGLTRNEWETEIPAWVFEALWPRTEGARVVKDRFSVAGRNHILEIDFFGEALDGLCLLEVEFPSESAARAFELPDWIEDAVDVTENAAYKNRRLALDGIPEAP